MKQFSFWEKDTFLKPNDLIIIGAEIVGLSSALFYRLHHPGARILVLDKGAIPEGASTRNAGFGCVVEWSGIMGFLPTKTPVLERLNDHQVVAEGLSGMGIAIGMQVGKEAAGLLNVE